MVTNNLTQYKLLNSCSSFLQKENQGVEDVFTWLAKTWYNSARKLSNSDLHISTINRSSSFKTSTIVY